VQSAAKSLRSAGTLGSPSGRAGSHPNSAAAKPGEYLLRLRSWLCGAVWCCLFGAVWLCVSYAHRKNSTASLHCMESY
jgi:hypothetical protein